jgi:hypothetical protein
MRRKAILFSWLVAFSAWAQEVIVFEFQADPGTRLSRQIENAIWEHTTVMPMPRHTYANEAFRAGILDAQTAAGFSRMAIRLSALTVAVWGKIEGNSVEIFLWDKAGSTLWTRRLPLSQGLLEKELSQRLAKAIAAAVEVQTKSEAPKEAPAAAVTPPVAAPPGPAPAPARPGLAPPETAVAPEGVSKPSFLASQTPFLRIALLGTFSWRSLCTRPGRGSCIAFDKLPESAPRNNKDFSSGAYGGVFFQAEYFPLALATPSLWKGLGLRLEMGYGRAKRDFVASGNFSLEPDAVSPSAVLKIQETHLSAEVLYRHFFLEPSSDGMGLHASVSLGYAGKNFLSKDLSEGSLYLPDIRRRSMGFGADTELSFPWMRFGLYANVFLQPKPGKVVAEEYGKASSAGYRIGGAISGMLYGPLGYRIDMSWNYFKDKFKEESPAWPVCVEGTCGGIIRETYFALKGGLLLEF